MFCLDTNAVIFALNGRRPGYAERRAEELRAGTRLVVSPIVLFELCCGMAKSRQPEKARALLDEFLSAASSSQAFAPIGPLDVLIAVQARRRRAALVTNNRREFERVPGLMTTDRAD